MLFSLALGFTFLAPTVALAESRLYVPFAFQFDNSFFARPEFDFSSLMKGKKEFTVPDQVVQDEAPVRIQGIRANVDYELQSGLNRIWLGTESFLVSKRFAMEITIDEIAVDAWIERIVSGVKVRVRMQASCRGLRLQLPATAGGRISASLRTQVNEAGRLALAVPWFEAEWAAEAWTMADFECTGTAGFKERIRDSLKSKLHDARVFAQDMRKFVADGVTELERQARERLEQPRVIETGLADVRLVLQPKQIWLRHEGRFALAGELQFQVGPAGSVSEEKRLPGFSAVDIPDGSLQSLYIPDETVDELNRLLAKTGAYVDRRKGQELSFFREIRAETINEVFVWPELQLYPKNADFLFDVSPEGVPVLGPRSVHADGSVAGHVSLRLDVQSWAPRLLPMPGDPSTHRKFTRFRVPFDSEYRAFIENGNLRILFESSKLQLTHEWDPEYLKGIRFTKVNTQLMSEKMLQAMGKDGLTFPIGTIEFTEGARLSAARLTKQNRFLRIDWR